MTTAQPKHDIAADAAPGLNKHERHALQRAIALTQSRGLAHIAFDLENILTRASAATVAEPGAGEPPLGGRWHHGNGVVVCGTLRIFGEDFDTDPAQDFKESILTWVCDTLNAAQDAYHAAQSGQRAGVAPGVREVIPLSDFSVELRFHSCRQAQAFIRAAALTHSEGQSNG